MSHRPASVPDRPRAAAGLRFGIYLVATVLVGAGVAAMVRGRLGVAPNDVLNTGLANTLHLGVGTASWITGAAAMGLAWVLGRRPRLPTILGGVIVGLSVNATLAMLHHVGHLGARAGLLGAGLVAVWAGIVGVVAADVGAGPLELIMLALVDRGLPLTNVRWGIELTLLGLGLLLGGDAQVGTAAFALATGPVLAVALPPACQRLGTHLRAPVDAAAGGY